MTVTNKPYPAGTLACSLLRAWRRHHLNGKERRLRAAQVFSGLSARNLRRFSRLVDEVHLTAGRELASVGTTHHFRYLVLEGRVAASSAQAPPEERPRTVLKAESDVRVLILDERYRELAVAHVPALRRLLARPANAVVVHLDPDAATRPAAPATPPIR